MSPHAPHRRTLVATDGNLLANPSFEVGDFAKHPVSWAIGPDGAQTATLNGTAAGSAWSTPSRRPARRGSRSC
jgi:hypothetical protein